MNILSVKRKHLCAFLVSLLKSRLSAHYPKFGTAILESDSPLATPTGHRIDQWLWLKSPWPLAESWKHREQAHTLPEPVYWVIKGNCGPMNKISPGTIGVIFNGDRTEVVLHLRDDQAMWSLPGGIPDFGETFEAAAIREIKEETGLETAVSRFVGAYSDPELFVFSYADGNRVQAFAVAVECRILSGELMPNGTDSLDVRWFPINALPTNLMRMHSVVIQDALAGGPPVLR
ncbi:NUDIX domain-containing protein [Devosia sp. A449]